MKKRVLVAMSGGVDSSVTAALLKKQGYDVIGTYFKLRAGSENSLKLVKKTAKILKIPFLIYNFQKEFKKSVFNYYVKEYKAGRTPNPCIRCNKEIKFKLFWQKAKNLNADYIATGHYAQIKNNQIIRARDKNKDQSYFLWAIPNNIINKLIFPVGNYYKKHILRLAAKWGLPQTLGEGSQDICFLAGQSNASFLFNYIKETHLPGKILNLNGKIIGKHQGIAYYTIGQRHGLGIFDKKPLYVLKLNLDNHSVVVGEEKYLYNSKLTASQPNWFDKKIKEKLNQGKTLFCLAKIRSGHQAQSCKVKVQKNNLLITFTSPQKAIAPGQSIVFYQNDKLLGGAVIDKVLKSEG